MDFWSAQDRQRKWTRRLLQCWGALVLGISTAVSFVFAIFFGLSWLAQFVVLLATLALIGLRTLWVYHQMKAGARESAQHFGFLEVGREDPHPSYRRAWNVLEEMAIASGQPTPALFVDQSEDINAFAIGLDPGDSAVCLTFGALGHLTRDELQGVVAHEMAHIANGDCRLDSILLALTEGLMFVFLAGKAAYLTGLLALQTGLETSGRSREDSAGAVLLAFCTAIFLVTLGVSLMGLGLLGKLAGRLLQLCVSRRREFLADATAVQYTRYPAGLASALEKVARIGHAHLHQAKGLAFSHMCFQAPSFGQWWNGWFQTHPPLHERIEALRGTPVEPSGPPVPPPMDPDRSGPARAAAGTASFPGEPPPPPPASAPASAPIPVSRSENRAQGTWRKGLFLGCLLAGSLVALMGAVLVLGAVLLTLSAPTEEATGDPITLPPQFAEALSGASPNDRREVLAASSVPPWMSTPPPDAAVRTPPPGSPERKAILDAMRLDFYPDRTQAEANPLGVYFVVPHLKVSGEWACVLVQPQDAAAREIAEPRWGLLKYRQGQWEPINFFDLLGPYGSEEEAEAVLDLDPGIHRKLISRLPGFPPEILPTR